MTDHVKIAIIGSGPGGLSAAITAAKLGLSHVLLERATHLSDTIYKYQKGKKVMAHPMRLPIQADLPFDEGVREGILGLWNETSEAAKVNVRYGAEVTKIAGQRGAFVIKTGSGDTLEADEVVLAIGLQGNLRKLPVPGADREWVQYQLDDPDAYRNERIIVVGAGDAGIENALALATHNEVSILNRQADFARAKSGNVSAVERAIRAGLVKAYHRSSPVQVGDEALLIETPEGQVSVPCNRIIARLGAIPPRKFLEDCGIKFPSKDPAAVPELSPFYESNVPGLFLIGALAGYTLIKQAINQGHEVVRRMAGNPVEPADEPLLKQRFAAALPGFATEKVLSYLRERVPVLAGLTMLQLREVMLESELHRFKPKDVVFNRGDYSSSLWNIADGSVGVVINEARPDQTIRIGAGEFFGELGLTSGRRRTATVVALEPSIMVEIPRRTMLRLQSSVQAIKAELDRVTVSRLTHTSLARDLPVTEIADVIAAAELKSYKAQETIIAEGDPCDALYILRYGSATVSRGAGGREVVLRYIPAGNIFGERGLLDDNATRAATIRASIASEVIRIDAVTVRGAMARLTGLRKIFENVVQDQIESTARGALIRAERPPGAKDEAGVTDFLVTQGVGEATNAFIIDEELCIRCDNCEKACASTHDGISRVKRDAGASAVTIMLPVACRHCENPHCMSDCPVDAITRAGTGEVFINQNTCIGCSNCANNCPYGVISMVDPAEGKKENGGFLNWLLEGVGLPPLPAHKHAHEGAHVLKAVKCDLCRSSGSPACVSACPTGAAARVSPEDYLKWLQDGGATRRSQ